MGDDITTVSAGERERAVQRLLALASLCAKASMGDATKEELMFAACAAKVEAEQLMKGVYHPPVLPELSTP